MSPGTSERQRGHFLPSRSPVDLNVGVSVLGGDGEGEGLVSGAASHGDVSEGRQERPCWGDGPIGRWLPEASGPLSSY